MTAGCARCGATPDTPRALAAHTATGMCPPCCLEEIAAETASITAAIRHLNAHTTSTAHHISIPPSLQARVSALTAALDTPVPRP